MDIGGGKMGERSRDKGERKKSQIPKIYEGFGTDYLHGDIEFVDGLFFFHVNDFGVDLGGADVGMTEQFGDGIEVDIVGQA